MIRIKFILGISLITLLNNSYSQTSSVFINNPSFETPSPNELPYWKDCGRYMFPKKSPVDIHGIGIEQWRVTVEPSDGETYIGMVAREDETWESITQKLNTSFEQGISYSFEIDVRLDEDLRSYTRKNNKEEFFDKALCLNVLLSNTICDGTVVFYTSEPIDNQEWQTIEVNFTPDQKYDFIILEAYYVTPVTAPYNGNIMIDNIRNFKIATK